MDNYKGVDIEPIDFVTYLLNQANDTTNTQSQYAIFLPLITFMINLPFTDDNSFTPDWKQIKHLPIYENILKKRKRK